MTKWYWAPGGSDANTGLSRAQAFQTANKMVTQLNSAPGPHTISVEGWFDSTVTGWNNSSMVNLSSVLAAGGDGLQFIATVSEDATAPLPQFCNYKFVTAAATFTNVGTNTLGVTLWQLAGATATTANRVRRVWAGTPKPTVVAQTLTLSATFGQGVTATAGGGTPFNSSQVGQYVTCGYGRGRISSVTDSTHATIWVQYPDAFPSTSIASGAWAIQDDDFYKRELWEGGTTGGSTNFNTVYPNLGAYQHDWTQYDATGTLTTNLYIASNIDPVLRWGTITYVTDEKTALCLLPTLQNWYFSPDVTFRGCGSVSVAINGGTNNTWASAIIGGNLYGNGLTIDSNTAGLLIYPYIDQQVRALPFYSATNSGHSVGSNEAITVKGTCDFAAATIGNGLTIKGSAVTLANGKPRYPWIADFQHAGMNQLAPTTTQVHQYITIEDGVHFDGSNVMYGRAFAFAGTTANVLNNFVGAIISTNFPTHSQPCGTNFTVYGGLYTGKPSIGDGYVLRWGGTTNKAGTGKALAIYTATGTSLGNGIVADNTTLNPDGMIDVSEFNSVAISAAVTISGNVAIRPGMPGQFTNFQANAPELLKQDYSASNNTGRDLVRWVNNVAVGYSGNVCRIVTVSPAVNTSAAVTGMTNAVTTGWAQYPTRYAMSVARHLGQLKNIV